MTDFRDFSLNCPDFGRLDATASAALLRQRHRSKKKAAPRDGYEVLGEDA
ncbi:hypothetical protein GS397_22105 [Sphingobium yanoikuyae]|uniref:Uncharacterized protein n=1 Tax=Sphingobium yanoikuyae TaxID=13690 RepID=A0A6P1GLL0_SPHYA|nr:hypothetical protein [Sphingobium yanoikuyae]QHD69476.1 hypothetical protein GS397_22105 [Sphingobium yanoikuyae]